MILDSTKLALTTFLCASLFACGGGGGSSDNDLGFISASDTFTLTLSGVETATVGTEIVIGEIDYNRPDLTGISDAIVAVDENTTIIGEDFPIPSDVANAVVMVVADSVISMTIVKSSIEHDYACGGSYIGCGGLNFDGANSTAEFDDATVINTDTGLVLTINGELQW